MRARRGSRRKAGVRAAGSPTPRRRWPRHRGSVRYLGPFKFEFQRPGRRACARGRAGPRPRAGSRGSAALGRVASCGPPPSPAWLGTLPPLNCLRRAPAATHAPTHAPAGPSVTPAARPAFLLGGPYEPGPGPGWPSSLTVICLLPPEEASDCEPDPPEGLLWWVPTPAPSNSSLVHGENEPTVVDRATSSLTGPSGSDPSPLYPVSALGTLEKPSGSVFHI